MQSTDTLDVLEKLVSLDTTSHKSNLDLVAYIETYLKEFGIDSRRVPSACGEKASLFATVGPNIAGGVVLSGHTDVVPSAADEWLSDPFTLDVREGRAYGRGTTDMKGFLAVCLAAVPKMCAANLTKPIHLAFSYDEEPGCIAAPEMIADMHSVLPDVDMVIVGEPTGMKIANMHKGVLLLTVTVTGLEAHSSRPDIGVSAIEAAAGMIADLYKIEDPSLDVQTRPTLNVGQVNGGTANNIIAGTCTFSIGLRYLKEGELETHRTQILDILNATDARLKRINPKLGVRWDTHFIPSLDPEKDTSAEVRLKNLVGANQAITVPFATEAGQFQQVGWSTVVMGPGHIDQAHTVDEFIDIEQLDKAMDAIELVIAQQSQ
ncbi:acetylornithine deacetylase [Sulfitobacter sp. 20_GPM-1509m]|uniref:acetylornithine deacetylase n=1 Tax=Sulfitobacter sp. 20_GPM-1509m TaxID=1380367 RepID=UPI0009DD10F6|nr:acetylornithine deacetylase [Sulfitobacter sp. 20_GPM-1509m]